MLEGITTRLRHDRVPEIAVRVLLAGIAVAVCYHFEWRWLRFLTSELNLRCDWLAGIPIRRLGYDTVAWRGVVYRYEIACIFADVWCGSIPLLWRLGRTIPQNLARIAVFSACLFAFNVARLSLSDILFSAGLPWSLAHSALGGASWFAVWVWLWTDLTREPATWKPRHGRTVAATS
jgi:hypothetical protein